MELSAAASRVGSSPRSGLGAATTEAAAGEHRQVVYVAGFWRRALGGLADAVLVLPFAYGLALLTGRLAGLQLPPARHRGVDYWLDAALAGDPALWGGVGLGAAIVVVYLFLFQAAAARTPGMRLLGLRVIDAYGEPPGVMRALIRTVGYFVAAATASLGFLWMGFDPRKRGLHDWLAGTYVIRRPPRRKAESAGNAGKER
jgi:uncharacterized RDD family membrane protein YckC